MRTYSYYIAQFNIARMLAPTIDDPLMERFVSNLHHINTLAGKSSGFVWQLQTEQGNSVSIRPYEDERILVNLSVWESLETMFDFIYQGKHSDMMRHRREWFDHFEEPSLVLWWVPVGHIPTIDEAKERLEYLRRYGPTPHAFTFNMRFPMPNVEDMC